jgi:hypothetical protein
MYEQDPKLLRNSYIVSEACSRWLRGRGIEYSFRDVIRSSHKMHEMNRAIGRIRRLNQLEFEEEMRTFDEIQETDTHTDI